MEDLTVADGDGTADEMAMALLVGAVGGHKAAEKFIASKGMQQLLLTNVDEPAEEGDSETNKLISDMTALVTHLHEDDEPTTKRFRTYVEDRRSPNLSAPAAPRTYRRGPSRARRPGTRRVSRPLAASGSGRESGGDDPPGEPPPLGRLQENAEASGFTHISSLIAAELARLRSSR